MIGAALNGWSYLNAPVSSPYCFGRPQDLAFQRARANLSRCNHMRLGLAPYTVEGRPVWVGQISRDVGIKLTRNSPMLTTHVIDPIVDEALQFLLESLLFRHRVQSFGFVRASGPATGDRLYSSRFFAGLGFPSSIWISIEFNAAQAPGSRSPSHNAPMRTRSSLVT